MKEKIEKENPEKKEKLEKTKEIDKKEEKITIEKIKEITNRFFNSIGFPILIGISYNLRYNCIFSNCILYDMCIT